ncbi:MAG: hypothetical protein GY749_49575 [Desulfobacteraceae bacterium]|nr:hypothetical protein [Desulfobacteraceae bacterium]
MKTWWHVGASVTFGVIKTQRRAEFDDVVLKSGDFIIVDGREGSVYKGLMKIREG